MLYEIRFSRHDRKPAQLETWDGVVIKATPSFYWAIGKPIESVIYWVSEKRMNWAVAVGGIRSPSLSETPSDAKLFRKTSP